MYSEKQVLQADSIEEYYRRVKKSNLSPGRQRQITMLWMRRNGYGSRDMKSLRDRSRRKATPMSREEIDRNKEFIPWIQKQRIENDSEIASLCKGAFILAETGLVNGKSCATHWTVHDQFNLRYPQVKLLPEKIISEDNGIYSSGGAYSFLNFLLYLIEKYCGRETAIWCSKVSEIEFDRNDQSYFMIFKGQREHNDVSIKDAQDSVIKIKELIA